MTYFADGSPYSFAQTGEARPLVNIGWLDDGHSYPTGIVPGDLVARLARLCRNGVQRSRGFHRCGFCGQAEGAPPMPTTSRDGHGEFIVGAAEIRVTDQADVTFAAPDMIIHYVADHGYKPPDEFLDALRSQPG
jgi:hypothetical protein